MAPKAHIFKFLLLAGLALPLTSASLAAPATSRAPPKKMEVEGTPDETFDAPNNVANNEYQRTQIRCTGGRDDAATCVAQKDAFGRAAQGYSYLAHYMSTQSLFARARMGDPDKLQQMQDSVVNCLQGKKCDDHDKSRMMQALIQYNLGKGVKSMILQSNTAQLNMKSVDDRQLLSGKKQLARQTGYSYTDSFKLTGRDLAEGVSYQIDAKTASERDKLGQDFKKKYEDFIDMYSSTNEEKKRWNFAHRGSRTGPGTQHMVWELDPETKAPRLKKERFLADELSQNQDVVKKQVAAYKAKLSDPTFEVQEPGKNDKTPVKPGQDNSTKLVSKTDLREDLQFAAVGLGMPTVGVFEENGKKTYDPGKIAAGIASNINKQIDQASKRELASAGPKKVPSVQINIDEFDNYLDKIWPETGYKYKIQSKEK